jgi:hypothetical protein
MKIVEGSYSSASPIAEKARRRLAATRNAGAKETRTVEPIPISQEQIANAQRAIARNQLLVGALEQLGRRMHRKQGLETFLPELMKNTQMGGERVLEPHSALLCQITATADRARLDELIDSTRQKVSRDLSRLVKDETALQNRMAVDQARGAGDLSSLLKRVVGELRQSGGPEFHLKRERVLDLLG